MKCLILFSLIATNASAAELRYAWKKGAAYKYAVTSKDNVRMSGMGMNVDETYTTTTRFTFTAANVRKDGTAEGKLAIESFEVKNSRGGVVAGIADIPAGALVNTVHVDAKGNFQFKEVVYVLVDDAGNSMLASAKVGPHGASGSAQVDGEEVSVYAEFDPKTGQLRGGYSVKTISKPRKKVAVQQNAQRVDVLPVQLLEMLRLPDGDVAAGGAMDTTVPGMASLKLEVTPQEVTAERAKIRTVISTKATADGAAATAVAAERDDDAMGDMPDMGGMGAMPGMPGGAESSATMGMSMDGDFTLAFDVKKGALIGVDGTLTSATSAAGMMKMTTTSVVSLKAR